MTSETACRWPPEEGSLEALSAALARGGLSRAQVRDAVRGLAVELVLTAHPTEVTRRTLMHKYDGIARCLAELDHDDLAPDERGEALATLRALVSAAWHTDEIRREQPHLPELIPGGDQNNPMGAAALTLRGGEYAIHGTNNPASIGGFVSYGCIRMYNRDIRELYRMVDIGTPVIVER